MDTDQLENVLHTLIGEGTEAFSIVAIEKTEMHFNVVLDHMTPAGKEPTSTLAQKATKVRWNEKQKRVEIVFNLDLSIEPRLLPSVEAALSLFRPSIKEFTPSIDEYEDTLGLIIASGIGFPEGFTRNMRRTLKKLLVNLVFAIQWEWYLASEHIFREMGLESGHGAPRPN